MESRNAFEVGYTDFDRERFLPENRSPGRAEENLLETAPELFTLQHFAG